MPNFKKYNYNQDAMVVINFEEQLKPGTFEFTLHKLIDNHIDLAVFYENYKNDAGGRSAYDPVILLKIILFAYSRGITSSRDIQWECEHNIIFKALSCDSVPHFTGIAAFVSDNPDAIESIFRSEEHTSELQSRENLVCRLLLEKRSNRRHESYLSQHAVPV